MKKFLAIILSVILFLTILPMAYAEDNNTYKVGDIIQFGSYPQSEVKDETLIAELNALAPEWEEWTSYGYYSGTGSSSGLSNRGSMVSGDWMRYTDVYYGGYKYRAIKFLQYRPTNTSYQSSSSDSFQDNNNYEINNVYWFKFEPICWRVLDPDSGLVVSEIIIDAQPYSNTIYWNNENYNDSVYSNYANDYKTSSIRKWLNDNFYSVAFTDVEKKMINVTTLNNNGYFTSIGTTGYEKFDSEETKDKIFLLSYDEIGNCNYGFNTNQKERNAARRKYSSDYAKSQGLLVEKNIGIGNGKSTWCLRSPGSNSASCCIVESYGNAEYNFLVSSNFGVLPALRFCNHNYKSNVTNPTCTTQGYTTYTCACGDSYIADYVNALGHKDDNKDYKCDNGCGYEFEKPVPEDPSANCSCNCHKGGISGFFWKIINFFNKLFKSKQYCGCGAKHW